MLTRRKSADRGIQNHGWLDTRHTFSFADYHDPAFMGFRSLRVINEDFISGGQGFGKHPHKNMEIVTYIVSGELAHEDSLGSKKTLARNEIQRITAGTGIFHSEFNASADEIVHLLQIWILPDKLGYAPSYEQQKLPLSVDSGELTLIVSPDKTEQVVHVNQDVRIYAARPKAQSKLQCSIENNRHVWLQLIKGDIRVNNLDLSAGDAIAASDEPTLEIETLSDAEFLLFDLN